jgi:Na+-driven multidrug efflux pump
MTTLESRSSSATFSGPMIRLFSSDPEVLSYGTLFIRLMLPFYLICVLNQVYSGALRGAGDARAPMVIMLLTFVAARQVYLFFASRLIGTPVAVAFGYPVGWITCSLLIYLYYRFGGWEKKSLPVGEKSHS